MTERKLDRRWRGAAPPKRKSGWEEQEARLPQIQPGGRLQPGSGAPRAASKKGDSTGDLLLVSAKTTVDPQQKGLRVERSWLEEIAQQAQTVRKRPALLLGFDREGAQPRLDWLALPIELQQQLIEIAALAHAGKAAQAKALADLVFG